MAASKHSGSFQSVFSSGAVLAGSRFADKLLAFVAVVLLSRYLGGVGVGEFFYYFSVVSLLIPVMDLGFEKILVRKWGGLKDPQRERLLGDLIVLKLIAGAIAAAIAIGIEAVLRQGDANYPAILAAMAAIYSEEFGQLLRGPSHAVHRHRYEIIVPLLCRIATLTGLWMLIDHFTHGYQAAYVYAISNFSGAIIASRGLRSYRPRFQNLRSEGRLWSLVKEGIPFSMTSLCVMLSLYVDSVVLGYFSFNDVGQYNSAYRIILVAASLSGGVCHALFPKLSEVNSDGLSRETQSLMSRTLTIVVVLFGTLSVGVWTFGPELMIRIYGADFSTGASVICWLCPIIGLSALNNVFGHSLEASGMASKVMSTNFISSVFNLMTNLMLIPIWGVYGAAVTTVLTEGINLYRLSSAVRASNLHLNTIQDWLRSLLFVSLMGGVFVLLAPLGLFLGAPLGCVAFAACLLPFQRYWIGTVLIPIEILRKRRIGNAHLDG